MESVCLCLCPETVWWPASLSVSLIHTVHFCNSTRGWWHRANIIGHDIPVHGALEFPVNWRPQGQSTNSIINMWQPEIVIVLGRKLVVDRLILVSIEHQEDKRHHHVLGWLKMPGWDINGARLARSKQSYCLEKTKHGGNVLTSFFQIGCKKISFYNDS